MKSPRLATVIALLALTGLLVAVFFTSRELFRRDGLETAAERARLHAATLSAALEQYRHLPFILSRDSAVIDGFNKGIVADLNRKLALLADRAGVDAIYVMNRDGVTFAASNWDREQTYIGNSYQFRPYFQRAFAGEQAEFFAIGVTTLKPGYFIAAPVYGPASDPAAPPLGVIAMKVDLQSHVDRWQDGQEALFVTDPRGVVALSTNPALTYRTTRSLSAQERDAIKTVRQFPGQDLAPLDIRWQSEARLALHGANYLTRSSDVVRLGWRLHYLVPQAGVTARATRTTLVASGVLAIFLAMLLVRRGRNIRHALSVSQADRRQLRRLNAQLSQEIEDRKAAETQLHEAQDALLRSSRLAALGRLSASVTHELGQPVAAMQNYLATAALPGGDLSPEGQSLIARLQRVATRIEKITSQLRFFARPASDGFEPFDLRLSVDRAREMMETDLQVAGIETRFDVPDKPVMANGERFRLEQVLINLIRNAAEALAGTEAPEIAVEISTSGDSALIRVTDNGPGVDDAISGQLFEPFVSTKAPSAGMGLGLAISASIVEEHGGTLDVAPTPDTGTSFVLRLPLTKERPQ